MLTEHHFRGMTLRLVCFEFGMPWNFPLPGFQVEDSHSLTPLTHVLQVRGSSQIKYETLAKHVTSHSTSNSVGLALRVHFTRTMSIIALSTVRRLRSRAYASAARYFATTPVMTGPSYRRPTQAGSGTLGDASCLGDATDAASAPGGVPPDSGSALVSQTAKAVQARARLSLRAGTPDVWRNRRLEAHVRGCLGGPPGGGLTVIHGQPGQGTTTAAQQVIADLQENGHVWGAMSARGEMVMALAERLHQYHPQRSRPAGGTLLMALDSILRVDADACQEAATGDLTKLFAGWHARVPGSLDVKPARCVLMIERFDRMAETASKTALDAFVSAIRDQAIAGRFKVVVTTHCPYLAAPLTGSDDASCAEHRAALAAFAWSAHEMRGVLASRVAAGAADDLTPTVERALIQQANGSLMRLLALVALHAGSPNRDVRCCHLGATGT